MTKEQNNQDLPQFGILKQFLKDMSFECPKSNLDVDESKANIEISVGLQTKSLDESNYEVSLIVNANSKNEETQIFLAEINYTGIFIAKNIPEEQLEMLLGIEAPQLLFPFARGLLMRVIAEAGCKVPQIEPINFAHLFMQAKNPQQQAPDEQKKIQEMH